MNLKDYQREAHKTSLNSHIPSVGFIYPMFGLAGEVGELFEKIKKLFRDHNGALTPDYKALLKKEIGDILWYLSEICTKLGFSLDEIAEENIRKLKSRQDRQKLQGSGDER